MNLKPLAFPVIFTVFYGITCLVAYSNGDHDGRIQQKRIDAEEWRQYMKDLGNWQSCMFDRDYSAYKNMPLDMAKICGMPPEDPGHK